MMSTSSSILSLDFSGRLAGEQFSHDEGDLPQVARAGGEGGPHGRRGGAQSVTPGPAASESHQNTNTFKI